MRCLAPVCLGIAISSASAGAHGQDGAPPAAAPAPDATPVPVARAWTPDRVDRAVTGADRWGERPLSLMGVVGIATPVGFAGGIAGYAVTRYLLLTAGAGLNPAGLQLAAMPRLRIAEPDAVFAMSVGSGASFGRYRANQSTFDDGWVKAYDRAVWWNSEAAFEVRAISGLDLRLFAGYAVLLNPQGFTPCPAKGPKACPDYEGTTLPYFGVALGQAF